MQRLPKIWSVGGDGTDSHIDADQLPPEQAAQVKHRETRYQGYHRLAGYGYQGGRHLRFYEDCLREWGVKRGGLDE